jgi:hypothetical protein
VPPVFGGFGRRSYPSDNVLIGYPLAYQYLTSLRPDSLPAHEDELLAMRGRGWLSSFSLGNRTPDAGQPLVTAFSWDTGVQVHASTTVIDVAGAVTTGTVGHPLVRDDNGGKQVAGRLGPGEPDVEGVEVHEPAAVMSICPSKRPSRALPLVTCAP